MNRFSRCSCGPHEFLRQGESTSVAMFLLEVLEAVGALDRVIDKRGQNLNALRYGTSFLDLQHLYAFRTAGLTTSLLSCNMTV